MNDNGRDPLSAFYNESRAQLEIDDLLEELNALDEDLIFATGFEAALIGHVQVFNRTVALYDREACLQILMERDGATYEDAVEYFDYNVTGAYVGEKTPAFATILRKP